MTVQISSSASMPAACRARCRSSRRRRRSRRSRAGGFIEVLATDPGSVKDFAAWARTTGNALVEQSVDGGIYRFVLRRK